MYRLKFFDEVYNDIVNLPQDIGYEVIDYFQKYQKNPYKYSKPLYNQGGLNLEGYRKTYVANATHRIVLKIEEDEVKIVEVVAVGKREDKEVYKAAVKRLEKS
jgi:mRNA interferase RelE/StbE